MFLTLKFELVGQQINVAKSAKLLGVIFDCPLTWNEHIDYVYKVFQKTEFDANHLWNQLGCQP